MELSCVDRLVFTAFVAAGLGEIAKLKSLVFFIGVAGTAGLPFAVSFESMLWKSLLSINTA